jgi:hypothetical protein
VGTLVNAPTWSNSTGFTFDGTSQRIDLGWDPTTQGDNETNILYGAMTESYIHDSSFNRTLLSAWNGGGGSADLMVEIIDPTSTNIVARAGTILPDPQYAGNFASNIFYSVKASGGNTSVLEGSTVKNTIAASPSGKPNGNIMSGCRWNYTTSEATLHYKGGIKVGLLVTEGDIDIAAFLTAQAQYFTDLGI